MRIAGWVVAAAATLAASAPASASTTIKLQPSTLPNAVINQAYDQPITATGGVGPYTFTVIKGSLPTGLALSTDGTLSGTPTSNVTKTFTVQAADSENPAATGTHTYTLTSGLVFQSPSLPRATIGVPYSKQIVVKGGTAPYQFTLASGSLPAGLSLDSSGLISGTPESLAPSTLTVQVTDSGSTQQSNSRQYGLTVSVIGDWTLCGYSNTQPGTNIDGVTLSPGGTMSDSDGSTGNWALRPAQNGIAMNFVFRDYSGTWNAGLDEFQGSYTGPDDGTFAMVPGLNNGPNCVAP
jgi:hypothetical protein